jgi:hypothetical protein
MNNLVSKEQATDEVNSWLEHKRISDKKRSDNDDAIEGLISAIEEGALTLNSDTKEFKLTLKFPPNDKIKDLTFKPRINVGDAYQYLVSVKSGDGDGRVMAHVCALTGLSMGQVKLIEMDDYAVCKWIAYFFL